MPSPLDPYLYGGEPVATPADPTLAALFQAIRQQVPEQRDIEDMDLARRRQELIQAIAAGETPPQAPMAVPWRTMQGREKAAMILSALGDVLAGYAGQGRGGSSTAELMRQLVERRREEEFAPVRRRGGGG